MNRSIIPLAIILIALTTSTRAQDLPSQTQTLITRGLDFLKSQQKPDGSWEKEGDPPAITAIALKAFVQSPPYSTKTDFVKKGYDKLLASQKPDGGIYEGMLSNYNTAIAVSSLSAANDPDFKPAIDKAVAFLKHIQWTNVNVPGSDGKTVNKNWFGGWGYGGRTRNGGRPDLSNVQLTMDALHDSGLQQGDPAYEAAIKFVTRQQNLSSTNDQPWATNDGGFIYGPGAEGNGDSFAGTYVDSSGQRRVRSYGSMTYAGLKSYIYAGLNKDDPRVKAAWNWIAQNWTLDENPGAGETDPAKSKSGLYYYYHTLARALNAYDQSTLTDQKGNQHDWRVELVNKLSQLQRPDGSWVGEAKWMESNPSLVTAYVVLALEEVQQDLKEHPAK